MNDKKHNQIKFLLFIIFFTTSCKSSLLSPPGAIAAEQNKLILITTLLMLVVVIPAIVMSLFFSYKYKEKNQLTYNPNLLHSKKIELIIWTLPVLIIIFLSYITWVSTHKLEPSKKIELNNRIKPIEIQVISLDWKWLFIYPKQKIATINYIIFPVNTPITFKITSNTVMNSFFIPRLGSQIYAMSGMKTELNLISNKECILKGFSANFSGKGFSDMKFKVIITDNNKFIEWIKKVKSFSKKIINLNNFNKISAPSINNPTESFSNIDINLFEKIISNHIEKK